MRTRLLFLFFFFLTVAWEVQAEADPASAPPDSTPVVEVPTRCRAQVSYVVKRAEGKEEITFFGSEHAEAQSEGRAKEALGVRLEGAKRAALEQCRGQHENLSGCIAAKYAANGALMDRLEFGARKSLQDAITADCQKAQGTCLESRTSEIECAALLGPKDAVASGDTPGDKKEASGGKKAPAKKK